MANETANLPVIPPYTLNPVPRLLPWISDFHLSLLLPVTAYWFMSLVFWFIDRKNYFSQYRLHTPAEFKQRNRVPVTEVLRAIVLQQIIQTGLGLLIGHVLGAGDLCGSEEHDVAILADRIHRARAMIPSLFALIGIDARTLTYNVEKYIASFRLAVSPTQPGALISEARNLFAGGQTANGFSLWEVWLAKAIYWFIDPAVRFGIAIFFSDTWQYFWHRAMHANNWMYRNMHAHHHRIYVPYAFGAFYNTLSEAFLLDTIGTTLSLTLSGLTIRQSMCFSTISVMKGVDDHCGYLLPWDPLQWLGEQNTAFHDVHHQSWGIKSNYSQLYTTFWDHFCKTISPKTTEEMELLYQQNRIAAENKHD